MGWDADPGVKGVDIANGQKIPVADGTRLIAICQSGANTLFMSEEQRELSL